MDVRVTVKISAPILGRVAFALVAVASSLQAQVAAPFEIKDPGMRALQQKYIGDLKAAAADARAVQFPYGFYFSRTLDVDEPQQQRLPQGSIRFDKFNGETVLQITGNYYAAYSAELMNRGQRARQTFHDVMLPLLQAVVPHFADNASVSAFALEISHHVRQKVLGVSTENPENIALVIPRTAAVKLVTARNEAGRQSALLEGQVFFNTEPIDMFLTDDVTSATAQAAQPKPPLPARLSAGQAGTTELASLQPTPAGLPSSRAASLPPGVVKAADLPPHDTSPQVLHAIQSAQQPALQKIVHDLDAQAHFVAYAPPTVIAFHGGTYLQFSLSTALPSRLEGSRYKLAALAFDEHISHLVRPVLGYFAEKPGFDGIDFSTSVRLEGNPAESAPLAVEFILPLAALRCYQAYNCTGQQLLDSGFVLINGERAGLDLQAAEATR